MTTIKIKDLGKPNLNQLNQLQTLSEEELSRVVGGLVANFTDTPFVHRRLGRRLVGLANGGDDYPF